MNPVDKPVFKALAQLLPCKNFSPQRQRQGSDEITNARHHLHLWLVRLRPLLLVLSLFL